MARLRKEPNRYWSNEDKLKIIKEGFVYQISTVEFKYSDEIVSVIQVCYYEEYEQYKQEFQEILFNIKNIEEVG